MKAHSLGAPLGGLFYPGTSRSFYAFLTKFGTAHVSFWSVRRFDSPPGSDSPFCSSGKNSRLRRILGILHGKGAGVQAGRRSYILPWTTRNESLSEAEHELVAILVFCCCILEKRACRVQAWLGGTMYWKVSGFGLIHTGVLGPSIGGEFGPEEPAWGRSSQGRRNGVLRARRSGLRGSCRRGG